MSNLPAPPEGCVRVVQQDFEKALHAEGEGHNTGVIAWGCQRCPLIKTRTINTDTGCSLNFECGQACGVGYMFTTVEHWVELTLLGHKVTRIPHEDDQHLHPDERSS